MSRSASRWVALAFTVAAGCSDGTGGIDRAVQQNAGDPIENECGNVNRSAPARGEGDLKPQGFQVQGFQVQGFQVQGFQVQGTNTSGLDVLGFRFDGVTLSNGVKPDSVQNSLITGHALSGVDLTTSQRCSPARSIRALSTLGSTTVPVVGATPRSRL